MKTKNLNLKNGKQRMKTKSKNIIIFLKLEIEKQELKSIPVFHPYLSRF